MPTKTMRHRGAAMAAGDTWYLMNNEGSLAAPGPLTVPVGMRRICRVSAAFGDQTATAASRNHGYVLKLVGVDDGEALLNMGALTGAGVTDGNYGCGIGTIGRDVDIPVTPGKQISPYMCFALGVDTSAPLADVTIHFD